MLHSKHVALNSQFRVGPGVCLASAKGVPLEFVSDLSNSTGSIMRSSSFNAMCQVSHAEQPCTRLGLAVDQRDSGAGTGDNRDLPLCRSAASAVMQGLVRSGLISLRRVKFPIVNSQSCALLSCSECSAQLMSAGCRSRYFVSDF